jgi:hypothetical protein
MSVLSNLAKARNWSKYRLMGVTFPKAGLTQSELDEVKAMEELINRLLSKWDERSIELGLTPLKKKHETNNN